MSATGPGRSVFTLSMEDLPELLARDLDGGFPYLVRELQHPVYTGLRRIHGADAEDLTQETFIRAYRALLEYDGDRIRTLNLRGWIWTIALNLGRNALRDQARRPVPVRLDDRYAADGEEPPDGVAWDRRLAQLSEVQRTAVVLRHVLDLPITEIAAAVGRPEGTVKADIHRGLSRLKRIMEAER